MALAGGAAASCARKTGHVAEIRNAVFRARPAPATPLSRPSRDTEAMGCSLRRDQAPLALRAAWKRGSGLAGIRARVGSPRLAARFNARKLICDARLTGFCATFGMIRRL